MTNDEFKAWRARMGLTVRGCAKKLGITPSTVQNYEAGFTRNKAKRAVKIPQPVDYACRWLEHCAKADKDPSAP